MKSKKIPFWKKIIAAFFRFGFSLRYKVELVNKNILYDSRVKIFLPNHQALIEPIVLIAHVVDYNEINPAVTAKYFKNHFFRIMMKLVNAIPVNDIESGKRDINVLNNVKLAFLEGINNGKNLLLYPSGQLTNDGTEKIQNKQASFNVINELPDNTMIVGVKISGFWGSMWSKAKTGKTPDFLHCLIKGILIILANFIFFVPKRKVQFEFFDISLKLKELLYADRKIFNKYLEDFYNNNCQTEIINVKYLFFTKRLYKN